MLPRFTAPALLFLSCSLAFTQITQASEDTTPMTSAECINGIDFTAKFLLENDAGIQAKNWTAYPENIQKILDTQKGKMSSVQTVKDCKEIAEPFLRSIRKGHLFLGSKTVEEHLKKDTTPQEDDIVTTNKLSNLTTYIFIPSFGLSIKDQLQKIIKNNQDSILNAQYLILDLRKNSGGFDPSAEPVYLLLGEAEYWTVMPQVYSSKANIQSWKDIGNSIPDGEMKDEFFRMVKEMQLNENNWTKMTENLEVNQKIAGKDVLSTPKKVVVLMDQECGSSCEELVKTIRQNPRIITMGRNTYGALDASNIRDVKTPSTKLSLYYATTYVHRRAGQEIDDIGIPPSIRLPKPNNAKEYENEVKYAQDYLEQEKWK